MKVIYFLTYCLIIFCMCVYRKLHGKSKHRLLKAVTIGLLSILLYSLLHAKWSDKK